MRKLIAFCFLCGALLASAAEPQLILKMKDGSTHSFLLASEPTITFADDKICFDGKALQTSFNAYEVSEYTYDIPSGINPPSGNDYSYRMQNNALHIYGSNISDISVYDESGKSVNCTINGNASHKTLHLASHPTGLYIVKVNNITLKVRIR